MSQGNSKMAKPNSDIEKTKNYNQNLIQFEKTKKNRIIKKYGKFLSQLSKQRLNFSSLEDEIKFLNQLYFLHQKISDLEECLDETNDILNEIKDSKKIRKSFHQDIRDDNIEKNIAKNLATLVFLSNSVQDN